MRHTMLPTAIPLQTWQSSNWDLFLYHLYFQETSECVKNSKKIPLKTQKSPVKISKKSPQTYQKDPLSLYTLK